MSVLIYSLPGKLKSSTTGYGIQALPGADVRFISRAFYLYVENQNNFSKQVSDTGFEFSIPSLFSREEGSSNTVSKTRDFFTKERGSIVVSEALCLSHRVDIRNFIVSLENLIVLL